MMTTTFVRRVGPFFLVLLSWGWTGFSLAFHPPLVLLSNGADGSNTKTRTTTTVPESLPRTPLPRRWVPSSTSTSFLLSRSSSSIHPEDGGILDVAFERVVDVEVSRVPPRRRSTTKGTTPKSDNNNNKNDEMPPLVAQSLLDWSLNADPRWKETRTPFCRGEEYIDGKVAFVVELEGSHYGIAVPFDEAVAVIIQDNNHHQRTAGRDNDDNNNNNNMVEYVNPDLYEENEEYQELLEIMAAQVQNEFGEDITLRKTPKVLTISGDLSPVTDQWETKVFGAPVGVDEMMTLEEDDASSSSSDEELEGFLDFMRNELGDEEFEKTMTEEPSEQDKEAMKFFQLPELNNNDPDVLKDLITSMQDDLKEDSGVQAKAREFEINKEDMALKLLSFEFGESGKSYSLMKLLRPYVLVGRLDKDAAASEGEGEDPAKGIRFELLTSEEESAVIPRLEEVCKEELVAAGLDLSTVLL